MEENKPKVGIIGASGYAGVELIRLLLSHSAVEIGGISSVSFEGKAISEIYPNLYQIDDAILEDEEALIEQCDLIFTAVPHGVAEKIAIQCAEKGEKLIDLGADFRLDDEADYTQWYDGNYEAPELHAQAVYGLPELFRQEIVEKNFVGNPGCYPTASALALAPALQKYGALPVIIDAKSGVTGAGRGLSESSHFPNVNEAFSPYKVAAHRHTPEIEQTLSKMAGSSVYITFVPHLLPINRGILATCYVNLPEKVTVEEAYSWYEEAYKNEKFVRVLPLGDMANIKNVKYSNYCDISIHVDSRTQRLIVVSAIDNMVKGAAGQAIQNMNLLLGIVETTGLEMIPPAF